MLKTLSSATIIGATVLVAACSSDTQFLARDPATRLRVEERHFDALPASAEFSNRTFGESEFVAERPGATPFYGVLPLQFSTGKLVVDILLFAPGLFFNLREVYPQYEFDVGHSVIRYREDEKDAWKEYVPTAEEADRARAFFGRAPNP